MAELSQGTNTKIDMHNIFQALHQYGLEAPENYLTESLALTLGILLDRAPAQGLTLLNQLCGLSGDDAIQDPTGITINTQVTLDAVRPDIEVRAGEQHLVYIEVKHDSPLGYGQLEAYLDQLITSGVPITSLVFLSRSRAAAYATTLSPGAYHHVCWYEIHDLINRADIADEVGAFFAAQFMTFLEEKKMAVQRVTWEYIRGVPALIRLTDMLENAVAEAIPTTKTRHTAGWSWRGLFLDGLYYTGIRFAEPLTLVFENNQGTNPTFKRDLDLAATHFFSLTAGEQFEQLIDFISQAAATAPTGDGFDEVSELSSTPDEEGA